MLCDKRVVHVVENVLVLIAEQDAETPEAALLPERRQVEVVRAHASRGRDMVANHTQPIHLLFGKLAVACVLGEDPTLETLRHARLEGP